MFPSLTLVPLPAFALVVGGALASPPDASAALPVGSQGASIKAVSASGAVFLQAATERQLRRAVKLSNRRGKRATVVRIDSTIRFGTGTGALVVRGNLKLRGDGRLRGPSRIHGKGRSRIFDVRRGAKLKIDGVDLRAGRAPRNGRGGAVRNAGVLKLREVVIDRSSVSGRGRGGAVYNAGGKVRVIDSLIERNRAELFGGGIASNGGSVLLKRSSVRDSRATGPRGRGGGIHSDGRAKVTLRRADVSDNSARVAGGGVYNTASATLLAIDDPPFLRSATVFSGNEALGDEVTDGGGAIYNSGGRVVLKRSRLESNTAYGDEDEPQGDAGAGGGIYNRGGDVKLIQTLLSGNGARHAGGGIFAQGGLTVLNGSFMQSNRALEFFSVGGAIATRGSATLGIVDTVVRSSTAAASGGGSGIGGALYLTPGASVNIVRSRLVDNVGGLGGAVFAADAEVQVVDSSLENNRAGSGAGLYVSGGVTTVTDGSVLADNDASGTGGGALFVTRGAVVDIVDATLRDNAASRADVEGSGGAVFNDGGDVTISGGVLSGNSATTVGGAAFNGTAPSTFVIETDVVIDEPDPNTAGIAGPVAYNDSGTMIVRGEAVPPASGI